MRIHNQRENRRRVLSSLAVVILLSSVIGWGSCRQSYGHGEPECIDLEAGLLTPEVVPISQIADSIRIIKFDLPPEESFRPNCGIVITDKHFVINTYSTCLLFDREGRFIRTIARNGKAPENYDGCSALNLYNSRIYITQYNGITKVYTLDGEQVEVIPSPSPWYDSNHVLDNERLIGFRSNSTGKKGLRMEFYTKDSVLHQTRYPREYTPKNVAFFPNDGSFVRTSGRLLFKELLNDSIYSIDPATYELKPVYRLNQGKYVPHDSLRFILDNPTMELFLHTSYVSLLGEYKSTCWLTTILGSKEEMKQVYTTHCYDRKTGRTYSFELKISPEEMEKKSIYLRDTTEAFPPPMNWDNFFPTQMTEDGSCLVAVRTNLLILAYLKEDPAGALAPAPAFPGWKVVSGLGLLLLLTAGFSLTHYRNNRRQLYQIRKEMSDNEQAIHQYRRQLLQYKQQTNHLDAVRNKTDELEQQIYLLELQNQELQKQLKQMTEKDRKQKQPQTLSVNNEGYALFMKLKTEPTYMFIGEKEHDYLCRVTDELYQQFATRLKSSYPELTRHDIETCCLLKAGLTNRELSIIFNNTSAAITKSKNRIKKRMGLDSTVNLETFLHEWH